MTYRFQAITTRRCSRCKEALTDPVSVQVGVGPICRKKDNRLYSLTIPANFPVAAAAIHQAVLSDTTLPPEPRKVLEETWNLFFQRTSRGAAVQDTTTWVGMDLREVVRNIDWLLSWDMSHQVREQLILTVEHCGYPALASVFRGEASMGECSYTFDKVRGAVMFTPKRNSHGATALYRAGARRVSYTSTWLVPLKVFPAFLKVVQSHYPMCSTDPKVVEEEITQWKAAEPKAPPSPGPAETPPAPTPSRPQASVVMFDHSVNVRTPWLNNGMNDFLSQWKNAVPASHRSYRGDGIWNIKRAAYPAWKQIAARFYDVVETT